MAAPTQGLGGTDPTTGQQITNGTTIGNYVMMGGQWYEWRDNKLYAPSGTWTGQTREWGSSSTEEGRLEEGWVYRFDPQASYAWNTGEGAQAPGGGYGGGTTSTYDAGGNLRGTAESNAYLNTSTGSSTLYPPTTPTSSPTPSPTADTTMADTNYAGLIRNTMGDATTYTAENPPSAGPNLSTTFPNYDPNSNIEQQYAEWRDLRRANGQDPYDMEAFRQHLVAIGAPDPGAPGTAQAAPAAPTQPGTTPTAPWTPPPAIPPAGPPPVTPGTNPPGYTFRPEQRAGTAQSLLGDFKMPAGLTNELDLERLFPWITDPRNAAANTMAQAGINPDNANPFTTFLQGELPRMANIARTENILGGGQGQESDIANMAQRFMGGGITRATGQSMIPQLAALARQYRSGGSGLNATQNAFSEAYLTDPSEVLAFISGLQNLAPDLRSAQKAVNQNTLRRFGNAAGGTPNASIWDFLGY